MEQQKTKTTTTTNQPKKQNQTKKEPPSPHVLKEFRIKNGLFHYCKCSLQSEQVSSVELGLPMAPLQQEMSAGLPHYHINTPVTCN